jgi:hypothetical protein
MSGSDLDGFDSENKFYGTDPGLLNCRVPR